MISSEAEELREEFERLAPRVKLFEAVNSGRKLPKAFRHYLLNERAIVASGFDHWRGRVLQQNSAADIPTPEDQVRILFKKDIAVARKFKTGVQINGKTADLSQLIGEGQARMAYIQGKLPTGK